MKKDTSLLTNNNTVKQNCNLWYNKVLFTTSHVSAQKYHNQALYKKYKKKANGFHYKNKPTINHKTNLVLARMIEWFSANMLALNLEKTNKMKFVTKTYHTVHCSD